MATNYFPDNYKPIYSPEQTFSYIDKYKKELISIISEKWDAISIDSPLLTSAFDSWDSYQMIDRYITFDSKNIQELSQVFSNIGAFMRHTWNFLSQDISKTIYCYSHTVDRDSKCDLVHSIVTNDLYVEMKSTKDVKIDDIKNHCLDFVDIIKSINILSEFSEVQNHEYDINRIGVITIIDLIKMYPNLSLDEAITQHVVNNGTHIIVGVFKSFENKKRFFGGLPASDDYDSCSVLFVYHEIINKVLPIIKISPRPSMEKIKNQLITDLPLALSTHLYNDTIFKAIDKYEPSVGIRIYFSNLMLINLKKYHLAEVVHSNWTDDFIEYVTKNKIYIM